MNNRGIKKPAVMCAPEFRTLLNQLSKAALIDTLWCACQLGTDESTPQITAQAARNAVAALRVREDRIPKDLEVAADALIDSDPT